MNTLQTIFDILIGVAGATSMFILVAVWKKLGNLEDTDKSLTSEISALKVLVAGEYVKRTEIKPTLDKISEELTKIRIAVAAEKASNKQQDGE